MTRAANNIRILAAAMVENAKSGHPGGAMGGADFANVLYSSFLVHDPDDPRWFSRDRFFLDPGHMSPMLYATLFMTGKYTIDDIKALDAFGVKVNSQVGNMATVQIPTKRFADFVASGLCSYINMGHSVYPMNDKARAYMGVDYIHRGVNLPQGYDGTGVVVGVVDIGFEYGHPSFYDTTGTTLRIKRVWQQKTV